MPLMSARKAAAVLGISHTQLNKDVRSGKVTAHGGLIDPEIAARERAENTDVNQQRRGAPQNVSLGRDAVPLAAKADPHSMFEAHRAEAWLKVKERKNRLDLNEGRVANLGEVNAFVAGMIIQCRDIFLALPGQLRDRLAQETDPVKCEELISAEIRRGLRKLAEFKPHAQ